MFKINKVPLVAFSICFLGYLICRNYLHTNVLSICPCVKDLVGVSMKWKSIKCLSIQFYLGGSLGGNYLWLYKWSIWKKKDLFYPSHVMDFYPVDGHAVPVRGGNLSILSGFGLGGVLVSSTTIMMEEWPSKSRASYMGYLSISIPIGIFSWVNWLFYYLPGG